MPAIIAKALLYSALCGLGFAAWADTPKLGIVIADGDPHDRIHLLNQSDCNIVSGTITIDFTASDGKIIIDTQYGGIGTKDPMPVEIEKGMIAVEPVSDGARAITIHAIGLPPNDSAIVTLDVDNNQSGWFSRRVSILAQDLNGTVARYSRTRFETETKFNKTGTATLDLPAEACQKDDTPHDDPTPVS